MISIIISSANKILLDSTYKNIEATIGMPYEILAFNNEDGQMGMCEVYNKGAQQAKYDILCYMHEDLDIKSLNWGKEVAKIFEENKNVGVIGVAGGSYKSQVPSGWAVDCETPNTLSCNYLQSFKRTNQSSIHSHSNPNAVDLAKVVCVDGMWFCTLRNLALKYSFDQDLLKGFHCYDIDYCLTLKQHYDVVVTFNILMEHFSEGGYSKEWFEDTLKVHKKWETTLPLSLNQYEPTTEYFLEKKAYKWILEKLIQMDYSVSYISKFLNSYRLKGHLKNKMYLKLLFYTYKFYTKKNKFSLRMFT